MLCAVAPEGGAMCSVNQGLMIDEGGGAGCRDRGKDVEVRGE